MGVGTPGESPPAPLPHGSGCKAVAVEQSHRTSASKWAASVSSQWGDNSLRPPQRVLQVEAVQLSNTIPGDSDYVHPPPEGVKLHSEEDFGCMTRGTNAVAAVLVGGLPFAACVVLLAGVGGLTLLSYVCAFVGFLLLSALPTITSLCKPHRGTDEALRHGILTMSNGMVGPGNVRPGSRAMWTSAEGIPSVSSDP